MPAKNNVSKSWTNFFADARQRSNIYGLLALLYRTEPTPRLIVMLKEYALFSCLSPVKTGVDVHKHYKGSQKKISEELALEYTTLFIASAHRILLNESVHQNEGAFLMGEAANEISDLINTIGMTLNKNWNALPDHISVEFEIMKKLSELEYEARQNKDVLNEKKYQKYQKEFLNSHIAQWIPAICDKIIALDQSLFYTELAALTKQFIKTELAAK